MKVDGRNFQSIWLEDDSRKVQIIDQTRLPFHFEIETLATSTDVVDAISNMLVRGAPLIGATAACGLLLATSEDPSDDYLIKSAAMLRASRPTAVNLCWALDRVLPRLLETAPEHRFDRARIEARNICNEDISNNSQIGDHGLTLLQKLHQSKRDNNRLNVLTHCNAGWLATVDWGTALAPVFKAHNVGLPVHVWVDETRPRNQGASLTAWELQAHGVPHTLISDNAGGHLMQHGRVDVCIVGSDRTSRNGDVCNKIGTYLKALAAYDTDVPFYAAVPSSTIDWTCLDGTQDIPIEEREPDEVLYISGVTDTGQPIRVRLAPEGTQSINPAFDVTPSRLVTGIITERGICEASEQALIGLYQDQIANTP